MKTKGIVSSLFMCFLMVGMVSADPNLVGHWTFDEGSGDIAGDSSGNNNDGILKNNPDWVVGQHGNALDFSQQSGRYVDLNNPSELQVTGDLTIAGWFFQDAYDRGGIVGKWKSGGASSYLLTFYPGVPSGADKLAMFVSDGSTSCANDYNSASAYPLHQWNHVAAVFDTSTQEIRVYLNGQLYSSISCSISSIGNSANNVHIGSWGGTNKYYTRTAAILDDIQIYDRVLSEIEISVLYSGDSTPPTPPSGLGGTPGETQIDLSWNPSSDPESGVAHYNVYRNSALVAQPTTNNFSDTGLTQNTGYFYNVTAVNGANFESAGVTGLFTTLADTTAPEILSANIAGPFRTKVNVTWSEDLDSITAGTAGNYQITTVVNVISAVEISPGVVELTTSHHGNFTVTANNVEDLEGNAAVNEQEDYSMLGCFI